MSETNTVSDSVKSHERNVNEFDAAPDVGFKKKKLLVTGSSGFIASRLVQKLREMGHDVYPYDIVDGKDLLNLTQLEEAIKQVDIVYHIAAQADLTQMQKSVEDGRKGVLINVEGTHNVAYLCAKHNKWLIYASTVCVYGNQKNHPETEDDTLPNPSELYSCSKYAGEWIVRGYGYNYGMPWTSLRFATIYGEGMRPALGLHIFFRQALTGAPITVHGDGSQDRTLTYVGDLVDGIVAPLSRPAKAQGQVINLTANEPISANRMAEDVKRITGTQSEIVHITQRPNQTIHEDFSVEKAKKLLGWEAKTTWEEGLKKTLEWMKQQVA